MNIRRAMTALFALAVLAGCGVDGAPVPPGSKDELSRAPNETPRIDGPTCGFASVHAGATL